MATAKQIEQQFRVEISKRLAGIGFDNERDEVFFKRQKESEATIGVGFLIYNGRYFGEVIPGVRYPFIKDRLAPHDEDFEVPVILFTNLLSDVPSTLPKWQLIGTKIDTLAIDEIMKRVETLAVQVWDEFSTIRGLLNGLRSKVIKSAALNPEHRICIEAAALACAGELEQARYEVKQALNERKDALPKKRKKLLHLQRILDHCG
jgi:hypothetical protein